ncbi:phytanoyl-CoA dioxygenase family protein [Methylosinus sporium]|uniref:phytanoyl-CoA dioxygenase family protein n=1 Tax=Methylosinus sporium TaxID=428 RepID=UPI003839DD46
MSYADLRFDLSVLRDKRNELEKNGFLLIEDALPRDYCEDIVSFIDRHLDEAGGECELGQLGSMQRIYAAEKYADIVEDFKSKCAQILSSIFSERLAVKWILAMRDRTIALDDDAAREKFVKGRWHYDSWSDQYKIFLFLRDIGPENGPFEFIPGTNGRFKKRLALTRPWWLFNPLTHFLSRKRPYQSISDERIQTIIDSGLPTKPVLAEQGSILIVNPSALLHRAAPLWEGRRYLAVAYF